MRGLGLGACAIRVFVLSRSSSPARSWGLGIGDWDFGLGSSAFHPPPSTLRPPPSAFRLPPSAFRLHPSSFIPYVFLSLRERSRQETQSRPKPLAEREEYSSPAPRRPPFRLPPSPVRLPPSAFRLWNGRPLRRYLSKVTVFEESATCLPACTTDSAAERKSIRLVRYVFDLSAFLPKLAKSTYPKVGHG